MTVQDIINAVAQDVRSTLSATSNQTLLIDYTDRVHKRLLRLTNWQFLLSSVQTFNTVAGESDYWLGAIGTPASGTTNTNLNLTDFDKVKYGSVVDRTNHKDLYRVGDLPIGLYWTTASVPRLYRHDSATPFVLNVYPPPKDVYAIEFRYYKQRRSLTATSDVLQIPDDYKDIVVAGVNELAYMFLQRLEEAAYWRGLFNEGRQDMIRDMHPFGRTEDFIHPDFTNING